MWQAQEKICERGERRKGRSPVWGSWAWKEQFHDCHLDARKKDGALSVHGLRFRSSKPVKARVDNQKFRIGNLQAGSFEPACTGFLDFSANYSQQK